MKVAVAVIFDDQQRILITRRSLHASHGGMWEFPGGKVDEGETAVDALVREVKEEVGLAIQASEFLGEINHVYSHCTVGLLIYSVRAFLGTAQTMETQMDLRWVSFEQLQDFDFPEANQQIIEMISNYTSSRT